MQPVEKVALRSLFFPITKTCSSCLRHRSVIAKHGNPMTPCSMCNAGATGELRLENPRVNMEAGQRDSFLIRAEDVGQLQRVKVTALMPHPHALT